MFVGSTLGTLGGNRGDRKPRPGEVARIQATERPNVRRRARRRCGGSRQGRPSRDRPGRVPVLLDQLGWCQVVSRPRYPRCRLSPCSSGRGGRRAHPRHRPGSATGSGTTRNTRSSGDLTDRRLRPTGHGQRPAGCCATARHRRPTSGRGRQPPAPVRATQGPVGIPTTEDLPHRRRGRRRRSGPAGHPPATDPFAPVVGGRLHACPLAIHPTAGTPARSRPADRVPVVWSKPVHQTRGPSRRAPGDQSAK